MGRTVAVVWHALFSIVAGVLYFFFVLPRWWELSGEISHTWGTVLRIVAGALIGLAALPVVFTWLRTRRAEYGTPQLALRLRVCSIVLHVVCGVLIIGAAVSEIWFSLDEAGRWLFGVYGAAAAIGLLAVFAFYLAFVAELPPPTPRPVKRKGQKKERKSRWRRRKADDAAEEPTDGEAETEDESAADEAEPRPEPVSLEKADETGQVDTSAGETDENPDEDESESDADEVPPAEDTVAAEAPRGGLRNRRPAGKLRRLRRRGKSSGVAVED